jgi:hypothetical protein
MTARKNRHLYDYGDLWDALEDAADEIERLNTELEKARTGAELLRVTFTPSPK